jgi:type IV pilus assembly protein PilP
MLTRKMAVKFAPLMGLVLILMVMFGCKERAQGPTTADFNKERDAVTARLAKTAQNRSKQAQARQSEQPGLPAVPTTSADLSAPAFASAGHHFVYDPSGKRDPFRNFMWERPDRLREAALVGPLEQFDLKQLSLVAVVWKTGSARALVEDPAGESYIVAEGSRVGRNEGRVISIEDGVVIVKETYVDYLGQETTKDIEMRMRRNEGG